MPTYYTASFISPTLSAANTLKSDMTTPTSGKPGIPNREILKDAIKFKNFHKIGTYYVTKEEYLNLSSSNLVDTKQLIPTEEDLNKYTITSSIESTMTGSYRSGIFASSEGALGENAIAWTLPYHSSVDPNNLYSGSGGSYTIDKYLSSQPSPLNPTKYNYVLDGTGVDLIAMDSSYFQGHNHADFYDKKGKTRVQYVNWNELVSEDGTDPPYLYRLSNSVSTFSSNHGMMLASTAAGLLNGFAKNANIYLMPTKWGLTPQTVLFSFDVAANLIIKFHQSKSIDTNTGYKRPTVAVISQAAATSTAIMVRAGNSHFGPFSASLELNIGANEGIRFAHINKNYIFVSSSTTSTYAQSLDMFNGTHDFKGTKDTWFVWKFKGGLDSLITSINSSSLNSYITPFSSSYNSNTLSITSSFPEMSYAGNTIPNQTSPVFIYTGSFDQNNNFRPNTTGTTDDTGSFVNYLGSPSDFPNHINSIVNNGVEMANTLSNNNIITSNTYGYTSSPTDLWGNSPINSGSLGGSENNFYWENGVNGQPFDIWQPVHEAICQEMADAGVIFVKSGGNRGGLISQTGSTVDAPYFNGEANYDVNLANNYFTLDVDQGTFGVAGEKIYYNRAQPSNGSAIVVGNGPIYQSTPSNDITSSEGFPLLQPSVGSNRGAGIDVWAPSKNIIHACPRDGISTLPSVPSNAYPGGYGRSTANHALLKNMTIDPSVDNTISASFNQLYNNTQYDRNTFSKSFTKESGGTSVAAPIIAGLICCWLQINPWANVKDVRNFIQSMPNSFPNSTIPFSTKKYLSGYIDIDATGSKINKLVSESQHYQMGINANLKIGHLPFSTPSPVSFSNIFTGSLSLSNFSFT
tara:strand:- start:3356 stop:5932 length:2577 start_codon:yes stop_codon:yes gene_type:complete